MALTVERRTGQFDGIVLGWDEQHRVDVGLWVHTATIDKELETTGHGHLVQRTIASLVAMAKTVKRGL